MKKIILKILKILSKKIIKKYNPQIVGITGSVGKTSTKEAIYAVLSFKYNVRRSAGSYNTEFGLPLTIIDADSGGRSVLGWLRVFYRACKLIIFTQKYPEILILEMGADRPGDISYLLDIVDLDVGVLTFVSETHLENFGTVENILKEKEKIVTKLKKNGRAILNYDNELVRGVMDKLQVNYYTYGFSEGADIRAFELSFSGLEEDFCQSQSSWDCRIWGNSFKVNYDGSTVPFFQPHTFGKPQVYAALGAIAVGLHYKMNLVDISESLRQYRPEKGRMNLIAGEKGTLIIDDSYNSSPAAVIAALEVVKEIKINPEARKFLVLGDMLEIGEESQELHRKVGQYVADFKVGDYLICVGPESKATAQAAIEKGMEKEFVMHFNDASEALPVIEGLLEKNDLILVKGSRGMKMERIVKGIMAEPQRAKELVL